MTRRMADYAKRRVGMATPGTVEYYRNAAIVLSQYARDRCNMWALTEYKLKCLAQSSDPETARIARNALDGIPYEFDDSPSNDD